MLLLGTALPLLEKQVRIIFIIRGVEVTYDFRNADLPGHIGVVRAHLHIGGTTASAADTNGDKLRVGVITNPTLSPSIRKTDYDLSRYDT